MEMVSRAPSGRRSMASAAAEATGSRRSGQPWSEKASGWARSSPRQ